MLEKHIGPAAFEFRVMKDDFEQELLSFRPDVVAISSVTQNFNIARQYACIAKVHNLPVILGGVHITALPQCLPDEVDAACLGEGEATFLELMHLYLDTGAFRTKDLGRIEGIAYRDNGNLVKTPARATIPYLDDVPHPKRSLVGYGARSYMVTSRGCPYRCVFCSSSRHWGEVRYASPEYVLEEIADQVENGARIIRFNDDVFTADKDRLKRISDLIVDSGFHRRVKFSCWARANTITPEIVQSLKAMNVVAVVMGLESGSDRVLKYLKGSNATVAGNTRAVNLLKDARIQTSADFIIGAPDETEEEIMATYNYLKKSRVDFVTMNVFSPLPGTPVWDSFIREHPIPPDMDWRKLEFKFHKNSESAIVHCKNLNYEQLRRLNRKFDRLVFIKTMKAMIHSPWIGELPKLVWKRLIGKVFSYARP
jgi:anaerobic magnesium-protoporphyrin IX monomethyl ester cyclase